MTAVIEPTCESVAGEVRTRFEATRAGLAVYWIAVQSSRDDYAQRLQALLRERPVGVIVLRRGGLFENPNSVMADVAALVSEARSTLEKAFSVHPGSRRWGVVVISRTPMSIGQSSSPVELPGWFPDLGGTEVHSSIEDITWLSRVTLDDSDLALPDLQRRLYELEGALVRRLRKVNRASPGVQPSLFRAIGKDDEVDLHGALDLAHEEWRNVPNPNGYRPAAKFDRAFVARLWSKTAVTKPLNLKNDLIAPLATGLQLDPLLLADIGPPDSLFAVLCRPNQGAVQSADRRFVDNLVWSVATAFRLLTASHHADGYGGFPYPLLYSVGQELRATIAAYEQALNLHE